jgi:predicted RNA binding protein YcfA (HicA-like mRNA interferase family)
MKLKKVSSKQMISFLKTNGIYFHHKKGSHNVLIKENCVRVVVPDRKELPIGTTLAILRESNISRDEFTTFFQKRRLKKRRNYNG